MDPIREMLDLGTTIMNTVTEAVEKNDYSGLSQSLKSQVGEYINHAKYDSDLRNAQEMYRKGHQPHVSETPGTGDPVYQYGWSSGWQNKGSHSGQSGTYSQASKVNPQGQARPQGAYMKPGQFAEGSQTANWQRPGTASSYSSSTALTTPFNQAKPGKGDSLVKRIFGVGGLALTGPALIATGVTAIVTGGTSLIVEAGVLAAAAAGSAALTASGFSDKKLLDKFNRYGSIIGNREFIALDELASMAGETRQEVEKNLDKMIAKHMLPQAKFDEKKTTLMLTPGAYSQYRLAEDARVEREKQEAARKETIDRTDVSEDIKETMRKGADYIKKIREYNDRIPDEVMSEKLDKLERIVDRIFAQVKKEPERAKDLNKFLNYYLPTTDKLVSAYIDLDKQPQVGENIINTKKEISEAIDTVNGAFETLLDSLFEDVAWDISSDISVMKTMMAQDGLAKDETE